MEKTSAPKKVGRPTMYSAELAERICQRIENGESERRIAMDDDMPSQTTMWRWKEEHPEFCKQSARAREVSAEKFNDDLLDLQDELRSELSSRVASGEDFPKGTVEAYRVLMQEKARQAALRDDSRFGDRKTVTVDTTPEAKGMAEVYARMLEAQKDE